MKKGGGKEGVDKTTRSIREQEKERQSGRESLNGKLKICSGK